MKFVEEVYGGDRGRLSKRLCWLFHAYYYWVPEKVKRRESVLYDTPIIHCIKCDWSWVKEDVEKA